MTAGQQQRYHALAITLHWVMAIAFVLMLCSGLVMSNAEGLDQAFKFNLYQWHKSLGVILLLAFFLRIGVRLLFKPPSLPAHFPRLEALAAKAGHWGLYALMLMIPLSGWVMVSSSVYGLPTIVFGLFEWPHVPGIAANKNMNEAAGGAHEILAYIFMAIIFVHIAAVIKHALKDKENLLNRMWWAQGSNT